VGEDSLAPGSQVVTDYLVSRPAKAPRRAGLQPVGYGCNHCIGIPAAGARDFRRHPDGRPGAVACCRATATRRPGEIRTRAQTIWRRRPWWSPMRWPGSMNIDLTANRSAKAKAASPSTCATSGRPRPRSPRCNGKSVTPAWFDQTLRRRLQGRQAVARHPGRRRSDLRLGHRLDLVQNPPYFEDMSMSRGRSPTS